MIQIAQKGVTADQFTIGRLRTEFAATGLALMPGLLTAPIVEALLRQVDRARFVVRDEVTKGGRRFGTTFFVPSEDPAITLIHFILNRRELFDPIEEITGCPTLRNFTSRIHRTVAGEGQHIDWHDDATDFRTVGLNINLSRERYTGGTLQLRNPDKQCCGEVGRLAPGDGFLFRIGDGWQHKLTPVEVGERTVAVGWFRTHPDWQINALAGFRTGGISLVAPLEGVFVS